MERPRLVGDHLHSKWVIILKKIQYQQNLQNIEKIESNLAVQLRAT